MCLRGESLLCVLLYRRLCTGLCSLLCRVWYDMVMLWYGTVMLWYGTVWHLVWYGYGMAIVRCGTVWYRMVWYDIATYAQVGVVYRLCVDPMGLLGSNGMIWYGMVLHGMVQYRMVWHGMVNPSGTISKAMTSTDVDYIKSDGLSILTVTSSFDD